MTMLCPSFPFGIEGGKCYLIVLIPDHCLSIYFPGQSQLSIPQYNVSLLFCIPNMNFRSHTVAEISLTKMWKERKMDKYKKE